MHVIRRSVGGVTNSRVLVALRGPGRALVRRSLPESYKDVGWSYYEVDRWMRHSYW